MACLRLHRKAIIPAAGDSCSLAPQQQTADEIRGNETSRYWILAGRATSISVGLWRGVSASFFSPFMICSVFFIGKPKNLHQNIFLPINFSYSNLFSPVCTCLRVSQKTNITRIRKFISSLKTLPKSRALYLKQFARTHVSKIFRACIFTCKKNWSN